jgi:hypothetical protein
VIRAALFSLLCLPLCGALAAPAVAGEGLQGDWPMGTLAAPSGQSVQVQDLMIEENPHSGELQVVVRLLAPQIAGDGLSGAELRGDMDWACLTWGVPVAQAEAATPGWVVVEMMEAPVERGIATPEIRRYFESYRLEGPTCIWELF